MHVLVVDDDPVVLELVAEQLGERGLSVATAESVEAALKQFDARAPDIVLADIRMSPRDGYELLDEVRGRGPCVPVVLMSSFAPPGAGERAAQAGAAGFLRKPFTDQEVFGAVTDAFGRAGGRPGSENGN